MRVRWMAALAAGGLLLIGPARDLAWAQAPPPLRYFSVPPCRVLDTRLPAQGPALASGVSRLITVTGGTCGIPAIARAIAANITSVAPTGAGNLKLYAGGGAVPPTSALNFAAGQTRANNGVLSLGGSGTGTLAILATVSGGGTVDAVLDATGYFAVPTVYVSPSGNDNDAGTCAQPVQTIQAAINKAAPLGGNVAVMAGTYNEASTIVLMSGVSVLGGFAPDCSRPESGVSAILVAQPKAIFAPSINTPTTLDLLTIQGADNPTPGGSAYGIVVVNSSGLSIQRSTIIAGHGGNGLNGADGPTGASGNNGGNASSISPGAGGSSPSGANGGQGGARVAGAVAGLPGASGAPGPSGGSGASGGSGGGAGNCAFPSSNGGNAPAVAAAGGPGGPGFNAPGPGASLGTLDGVGNYVPPAGLDGFAGPAGGGGGGGGSGGGTAHGTDLFCADCASVASGPGGGGGGGGAGGIPGQGGRGGGASFALAILDGASSANAIIMSSQLTSGDGGKGGAGGSGGSGGAGGLGGLGAGGQTDTSGCSPVSGGAGASGSAGGAGGKGGGGSGGTGGASACIAYKGPVPTTSSISCTNGTLGTGGNGGNNGIAPAPKGSDGVTTPILALQ